MDENLLKAKIMDFIIDNVYVDNKIIIKSEIIRKEISLNKIYKKDLLDIINKNYDFKNYNFLINDGIYDLCEKKYLEDKDDDYFYFTSKGYEQYLNISTFENEYKRQVKETKAEKDSKQAKILSYIALILPILYIIFEQIMIKII